MNLRTERLCLRPVAETDAEAMFVARGDAEVMRYWDWPAQNGVSDVAAIIAAHKSAIDEGSVCWWVVALSPEGPAIGECDLSEIDAHHRRAEVGFLFARAAWGQGYAGEAMRAVMAHGFGDLGLERLWARVHAGNTASVRLVERLGFAHEGLLKGHILRDGARRDCLVYGRLRT